MLHTTFSSFQNVWCAAYVKGALNSSEFTVYVSANQQDVAAHKISTKSRENLWDKEYRCAFWNNCHFEWRPRSLHLVSKCRAQWVYHHTKFERNWSKSVQTFTQAYVFVVVSLTFSLFLTKPDTQSSLLWILIRWGLMNMDFIRSSSLNSVLTASEADRKLWYNWQRNISFLTPLWPWIKLKVTHLYGNVEFDNIHCQILKISIIRLSLK